MIIDLLLRIGIIRRRCDGSIRWPLHFAPGWKWRHPIVTGRCAGWLYLFRNLPGVVKWREGRLLPVRWGFGIAGLIEFGDRG